MNFVKGWNAKQVERPSGACMVSECFIPARGMGRGV